MVIEQLNAKGRWPVSSACRFLENGEEKVFKKRFEKASCCVSDQPFQKLYLHFTAVTDHKVLVTLRSGCNKTNKKIFGRTGWGYEKIPFVFNIDHFPGRNTSIAVDLPSYRVGDAWRVSIYDTWVFVAHMASIWRIWRIFCQPACSFQLSVQINTGRARKYSANFFNSRRDFAYWRVQSNWFTVN